MNTEENNKNSISANDGLDNSNDSEIKTKSKILIVIEIILLLLVIVLAIIFFAGRGQSKITLFSPSNRPSSVNNQTGGEGDQNVQANNIESSPQANVGDSASPSVSVPKSGNTQVVESYRLNAPVPDQSPVSSENDIPEGAIQIEGLENGFSPNEFTVSPGEEVTLALTSRIKYPVILTFYEESMPAISIGCGPYETRWVTFTAPNTSGEYTFRNDVFGKSEQTGKMIVR